MSNKKVCDNCGRVDERVHSFAFRAAIIHTEEGMPGFYDPLIGKVCDSQERSSDLCWLCLAYARGALIEQREQGVRPQIEFEPATLYTDLSRAELADRLRERGRRARDGVAWEAQPPPRPDPTANLSVKNMKLLLMLKSIKFETAEDIDRLWNALYLFGSKNESTADYVMGKPIQSVKRVVAAWIEFLEGGQVPSVLSGYKDSKSLSWEDAMAQIDNDIEWLGR